MNTLLVNHFFSISNVTLNSIGQRMLESFYESLNYRLMWTQIRPLNTFKKQMHEKAEWMCKSLIKHLLHWNKCNSLHKNWFMNDLNSFCLIFNEWGPLTTLPLCKWLDHLVYFSDLKTNRNGVQQKQSLRKEKTHDLNAFSCDFGHINKGSFTV